MNIELKALLKLVLDSVKAGKAALDKQDFVTGLIPKLYAVAADVPVVVAGWKTLPAEWATLVGPGTAEEADLLAFIGSEVGGILSDDHAKTVLAAVLKLAADVAMDIAALHAALNPAPVA